MANETLLAEPAALAALAALASRNPMWQLVGGG